MISLACFCTMCYTLILLKFGTNLLPVTTLSLRRMKREGFSPRESSFNSIWSIFEQKISKSSQGFQFHSCQAKNMCSHVAFNQLFNTSILLLCCSQNVCSLGMFGGFLFPPLQQRWKENWLIFLCTEVQHNLI